MFNFFITPYSKIEYPIKTYYKFEYIKRRYAYEINKIKDYYRNRDRAVKNSHILSRLIVMLSPNYNTEDFEYFKIIDTNSRFISKQFNIVSNISNGKVLNNELYKDNSYETLIYTNKELDLNTLKLTWMNEVPLRCVQTTSTDINFSFPYENVSLPKSTYSVFELDVNLMLMMYKYWCLDRVKNDMSTNPNVFIATYVLPNTLESILDMGIFNRFLAYSNNNKVSQNIFNPHPFTILNYSTGIDEILKSILRDVRGEKIYLEQLLLSIPAIGNDTMLPVVKLTNKYYTRQSRWVLWSARMKTIRQLLYILGKKGRNMNRSEITKIPFIFKTIKNRESDIEAKLPETVFGDFKNEIGKIKKLIKK